jgi:hypothetical protein
MSFIEDAMKEAPKKFNRYVRKTLDMEQHRADYAQWHNELVEFQKENPSYPSFEEMYGRVLEKRKRLSLRLDTSLMDTEFEIGAGDMDVFINKYYYYVVQIGGPTLVTGNQSEYSTNQQHVFDRL